MKFTDANQIKDFLDTVNQCEGDVILTSIYGDRYNLKSLLTQQLLYLENIEMNLSYFVQIELMKLNL